jgi:hypothetical protein
MCHRLLILIAILSAASCSEPPSDEVLLRALVERAELAAEARDTGDLMALIAPHYTGEQGEDFEGLQRVVRGYFIVNQQVHVLTRIREIELLPDGTARIDMAVALARRPLTDVGNLTETRADLFRLDLQLSREDGEWQIFTAEQRRAGPGDFL